MTTETIHTCSYSCQRIECIRAQRDELASRLAAAPPPAAEGVQAGEVSAEDVAVLHRIKAALPDVGVNGWHVGVQALERVLAALSQQPEARGVVDGAMLERATRAYSSASIEGVMELTALRAALTAALTGERNG